MPKLFKDLRMFSIWTNLKKKNIFTQISTMFRNNGKCKVSIRFDYVHDT